MNIKKEIKFANAYLTKLKEDEHETVLIDGYSYPKIKVLQILSKVYLDFMYTIMFMVLLQIINENMLLSMIISMSLQLVIPVVAVMIYSNNLDQQKIEVE